MDENKNIQSILEEGFIFLTERFHCTLGPSPFFSRSDFWRNQKPMYVEEGERMTRRMSMMEDTETRMKRGPDKTALFTIRLNL